MVNFAEKSSVWVYLFLSVTIVQQMYQLKKKSKKVFTLDKFAKRILVFEIDETNKNSKRFINILKIVIYFFTLKTFWGSLMTIQKAYLAFFEHYPDRVPQSLVLFCLAVFSMSLIFVAIAYGIRKSLWRYKPLILFYIFTYQIFVGFVVSKFTAFQYSPKIFSITPNVASEAWVDVIITGKNFQDLPFTGKILVGGVLQAENVISWSDERVVFRTNPTLTKSGDVCIETHSKGNTNCLPFEYNFGKNNK